MKMYVPLNGGDPGWSGNYGYGKCGYWILWACIALALVALLWLVT